MMEPFFDRIDQLFEEGCGPWICISAACMMILALINLGYWQ